MTNATTFHSIEHALFFDKYGADLAGPMTHAFFNWRNASKEVSIAKRKVKYREREYTNFMNSKNKAQDIFDSREARLGDHLVIARTAHATAVLNEQRTHKVYSNLVEKGTRANHPILIPVVTALATGIISALIDHYILRRFYAGNS